MEKLLLFITIATEDFLKGVAALGAIIAPIIAYKKGKADRKKIETETESIDINDKIIVNKYNKQEYEELKKAFEELEQKFIELKKNFQKVELEKDEIQRKFNVFKNIKTEE